MSRIFTKLCLTLFLIAGISSITFAQDENNPRPLTKSGSAAWVFSVNGLGNFGLGGMMIGNGGGSVLSAGYKYYLSDDMALRAMLGFNTSSSGEADDLPNGKETSTGMGIAVGVEMHTRALYSTSPYFGAMLSYGMGSQEQEVTVGGTTSSSKMSTSSFGIGLLAGFDWYFTDGLAVGGEYSVGFSSASSSSESGGNSTDGPGSSHIGIAQNGNVHLVVHF